MFTYSVPDFWLGMLLLALFAVKFGWFPTGGFEDAGSRSTGLAAFARPAPPHDPPGAHAHDRLLRRVHDHHAVVVARSARRGLPQLAARQRTARIAWCAAATRCPNAILPVVSLSALNLGFVLSGAIAVEASSRGRASARRRIEAIRGPDYPMLQGLFLLFSAAIIFANLITDLVYGYLDPRVRTRMTDDRRRRSTASSAAGDRLLAASAPAGSGASRPGAASGGGSWRDRGRRPG